jgi:hypothetical protein
VSDPKEYGPPTPWIVRNPTIITALLAYAVGLLAWGWHISEVTSVEAERGLERSQHILEAERRIRTLEDQLPVITALAVRVTSIEKSNDQQDRRVDSIDTQGTRMLTTVENRQADVLMRLARIEQFVVENNKRLDAIEQTIRALQVPRPP